MIFLIGIDFQYCGCAYLGDITGYVKFERRGKDKKQVSVYIEK